MFANMRRRFLVSEARFLTFRLRVCSFQIRVSFSVPGLFPNYIGFVSESGRFVFATQGGGGGLVSK